MNTWGHVGVTSSRASGSKRCQPWHFWVLPGPFGGTESAQSQTVRQSQAAAGGLLQQEVQLHPPGLDSSDRSVQGMASEGGADGFGWARRGAFVFFSGGGGVELEPHQKGEKAWVDKAWVDQPCLLVLLIAMVVSMFACFLWLLSFLLSLSLFFLGGTLTKQNFLVYSFFGGPLFGGEY